MQQKVQLYIEKHRLLSPGDKIIVGLSGGADSVALLHILILLGYDCIAAHCNFHLRSNESNRDEHFVRKLCASLDISLHTIDFETYKYAGEQNISIEMAARDLRYGWFHELLEKEQAQAIAVAHHADDNIETLLMNLTRGTGLRGLTGIPVRNGKIARPLLCCTRREIEQYLSENNVEYVNDSTNASNNYTRNKIRNTLIPLLEEINPSVRRTLYDSLSRFGGSFNVYEQALRRIEKEIVVNKGDTFKIDIALLKRQVDIPTILFEILQKYEFNAATIEKIVENIDNEPGKQFFSTSGYRLTKDRKFLIVDKPQNSTGNIFISESDREILHPLHLKIQRFVRPAGFSFSKDRNCVHIDAAKLQFPLELRSWQAGDSFYPLGMTQQKKLSDFFVDLKLSRPEKEQVWLLVSGTDLVWVVGQRLDNRFKISDETIDILELSAFDL
ncbi:MAG: tRNA lysidine(34) synthetase TilS [Prevotellaceae bacterium]|nr:tRNA lysidine(34) synthetase TilS [Prevotellaceae bacterium]